MKELFISTVRVRVIKLFLTNPNEQFHVREITRRVGAEINAVRRELSRLRGAGFLKKTPRGNKVFYSVKGDFIFYDELLGMVAKETGIGKAILEKKEDLGKINFAMLARAFVKGRISKPSEVDLLLVGKISTPLISKLVEQEQQRRGHEINFTVLTPEEFDFRKRRKDPFILDVLSQPRIVLLGNEEKYCQL
jgi:DNA-binding transcriptional ArsR family regulator